MNDDNLDLLDLDDTDTPVDDNLPDATPFAAPRPHRPWLLLVIGLAIIILAVFIIIRVVGSNSSSSIDVDLGAPIVVEERTADVRPEPGVMPPAPMPQPGQASQPAPAPMMIVPVANPAPGAAPVPGPVAQPQPMPQPNQNVRVIEDRKDVTFDPSRAAATPKPIPAPAPKTAKTPTKPKPAPKPAAQKVANGGWYVQFGSYSTRAAAEASEKKIRAAHPSLFSGKQFVILAAVLPSGQTTYRLRVAFANSNDANGFCRNAKSDGLDCYVAK
ncbi:MAG: SPOR domain-containing protein [Alphaproteobacteria bacterium]|nr:SPOR domain-containing protein [Alphaproteobacteria bacterium]